MNAPNAWNYTCTTSCIIHLQSSMPLLAKSRVSCRHWLDDCCSCSWLEFRDACVTVITAYQQTWPLALSGPCLSEFQAFALARALAWWQRSAWACRAKMLQKLCCRFCLVLCQHVLCFVNARYLSCSMWWCAKQ